MVFFIPKLRYSVKIQLLKSNFTSCRVLNRTSAGTGPLLTGSGSCYFFLTGSGNSNFTYKKVPKISFKNVSAFLYLHRHRHQPRSAGYSRLRLHTIANRNRFLRNRDSLHISKPQAEVRNCGPGSHYFVFFITRRCYSLKVQLLISNFVFLKVQMARDCGSGSDYSFFFIGCGPNSNMCLCNRDSLHVSKPQAEVWNCGSGSHYLVFFIPGLRYSLQIQLLTSNFVFLKVQMAQDCGSGSEYSFFFIGCSPSSNMCLCNRDNLNVSKPQVEIRNCGSGSHYSVFFIPGIRYSLQVQLLTLNFIFLKVQMAWDCGSGSDYSVFSIGCGPNSNVCLGNRDSLNFLNLQVQDLDCGSGSDYIVFLIPKPRYSLQVQRIYKICFDCLNKILGIVAVTGTGSSQRIYKTYFGC